MSKSLRERFLKEYSAALSDDSAAMLVGAGVSMAAGYPSWADLLKDIGDELGVRPSDIHDLAALAQWSIGESGSATRVLNVIKEQIEKELDIPKAAQIIARLPLRHIWTTNYDTLIERAFKEIRRPIDPIPTAKKLALKAMPGAARLYKMHGSIDQVNDVVISTDHYELYRSKNGAFLPLLQAHLTSMSMLFVGLSFADPNLRHVLSLIREAFTENPPTHYAIVRPPHRDDCASDEEFKARIAQHRHWAKDLQRYGLTAIEIDSYDEIPQLLGEVERRVAARRVWISGSWPLEGADAKAAEIYSASEDLGKQIGTSGLSLVSGAGLVVGSASISGFLGALRASGSWDLDRRLIVRPFPQPLAGEQPDKVEWRKLRTELARTAGVAIFLGGKKVEGGDERLAAGVLEEFELARDSGVFLIPIGRFGGAAQDIAKKLVGSDISASGSDARRPSDDELRQLADETAPIDAIVKLALTILGRASALK